MTENRPEGRRSRAADRGDLEAEAPRDAVLLGRFRDGDPAALDEIVRAHRVAVYRVARRILGSHEDADEAAQVAFVKAWRALGRFRGESSIRTWLIRIVLNVSRSMLSSRKVTDGIDAVDAVADGGDASDTMLRRREDRERVRAAVAGLPPRQREVVILKVFHEMTYSDVARVMDLTEGAVKAHLHQAVANLRRMMAPSTDSEAS